jgi:class I lanthipeptide synthase
MQEKRATSNTNALTPAGDWHPLLDNALRKQALEATYSIAEELRSRPVTEASLSGGLAGLGVLHTYLAQARSDCGDAETALRVLDKAANAVSTTRMSPSLYGGFTGVAWAFSHLEGRLLDSEGDDPNEAIDEALKTHLGLSPWQGDYDLISGLVGLGVYAMERLPRLTAIECLELIVDRLDETAERDVQGVTWFTVPELLPAHQRQVYPQGYYNLGLAHGVPGVIALLGQMCATRDKKLNGTRAKARPLLDGAIAWLLAQQPADPTQGFSYWTGPGISAAPSRLAWCYGDLGIAASLLAAARCVREPVWERQALIIACRASQRPAEQSLVKDSGLCHGASGVGHLFNRLFQASGVIELKDAARYWFECTLKMRRPGKGIAGFSAFKYEPGRPDEEQWVAEAGILEGAAGIALALLAAATPIEPEWDRMLLLSAPKPS